MPTMKLSCFIVFIVTCVMFDGIQCFFLEDRVAAEFPSECCHCNDTAKDSSHWCSSPGVCDRNFHMCPYCMTTRTFDGKAWKVARGCGTVETCGAKLVITALEPSCWPHATVKPSSGMRCHACCHSRDRFDPHYCRKNPDAHHILY